MDKRALNDILNQDLAGELSAIIPSIAHAAKATGSYRPRIAEFFLTKETERLFRDWPL